jgi:hypothetical protein
MTAPQPEEDNPYTLLLGLIVTIGCMYAAYHIAQHTQGPEPAPLHAAPVPVHAAPLPSHVQGPSLPDLQRSANQAYFGMLVDCNNSLARAFADEESSGDPLNVVATIDALTNTIATADIRNVDEELQDIASEYAEVLFSFQHDMSELARFQAPDELLRVFIEAFARGANGSGPEVVIEGTVRYKRILEDLRANLSKLRAVTFRANRRANQLGLH